MEKKFFFWNRLSRFVSRKALNYLICYYEIIIPNNWTYTANDKISLILIYFSSLVFFFEAMTNFHLESADNLFYYVVCGTQKKITS